jgi:NAD(P)-dependent dehydrogenase (short-subunit alcohol dehydrogenase family)
VSTVLITGSSTGFGYLTALGFARQGHTVFASMRNLDKAGPLQEVAAGEGLDLTVIQLDVTDAESVERAVKEVLAAGPLDVLVNNAGIELRSSIEDAGDAEILAQLDTNVLGLVRVTRAVLPSMREHRAGVIVNISSIAGLVARPFGGFYSASKHAVEAISEALHFELAEFGVRVAIVEPGQFATALGENAIDGARFDEGSPYWPSAQRFDVAVRTLVPEGEPADPAAVVATILAVASDGGAPLRTLVGADAELIMSVRTAGDFESYEHTMRSALDWWD